MEIKVKLSNICLDKKKKSIIFIFQNDSLQVPFFLLAKYAGHIYGSLLFFSFSNRLHT